MSAPPATASRQSATSLHRHLFIVDNIALLRRMDNESVDLIVTDPPFGKTETWTGNLKPSLSEQERADEQAALNAWGAIDPESAARVGVAWPDDGQQATYKDIWTWEDVHEQWMEDMERDYPAIHALIEALRGTLDAGRQTRSTSLPAYLGFMAARLVEMHRVLKPTGSLFLHCDYTANSYLRMLLDAVFDAQSPTAEIVWQRNSGRAKGSQHRARKLGVDTDTILHYAKAKQFTWHAPTRPLTDAEAREVFPLDDNDGRGPYKTGVPIFCAPSMGPRPNLCYTYQPLDPNFRPVTNPHPSGWRVNRERLAEMDRRGEIIWHPTKQPKRKSYEADYAGQPVGSLWDDIGNLGANDLERTGYPTQKPVKLAVRMIAAASNPGDLVFDPFAGCAYVPVAAELLDRKWVACDISPRAMSVIRRQYGKPWAQSLPGLGGGPNKMLRFSKVTIAGPPDLPARTDTNPARRPSSPLPVRKFGKPLRWSIAQQKEVVAELSGWACWACGYATRTTEGKLVETLDHFHYDHIKPLAAGGDDEFLNRALLCGPCNMQKGAQLISIDEFRGNKDVKKRRRSYGIADDKLPDIYRVQGSTYTELERRYPVDPSAPQT